MIDPSPHPDLLWLVPRGAQHLVEEVRERVIRGAVYRPFEGSRRVFVIEAAEALRDESQNALLKTLEEPPPFAFILLLSAEPELLLETVISRCQEVEFAALPVAAVEAALAADAEPAQAAAAARLAGGDVDRARFLLSEHGARMREQAEAGVATALAGEVSSAPWRGLLDGAEEEGRTAEAAVRAALEQAAEEGVKRTAREITDEARRAGRRRRTDVLDLGLELCGAWLRDLAATAVEAPDVVFNRDRVEALREQATGLDPLRARAGIELVQDTRRRLELNVSEELALEALFYRLERELGG